MPKIIKFSEIVEENGKTIKENNLEKKHKYPLGTIVEVEVSIIEDSAGAEVSLKGICKLFVVRHHRDCDGTPLYILSDRPVIDKGWIAFSEGWRQYKVFTNVWVHGYSEDSLKPTGKYLPLMNSFQAFFGAF